MVHFTAPLVSQAQPCYLDISPCGWLNSDRYFSSKTISTMKTMPTKNNLFSYVLASLACLTVNSAAAQTPCANAAKIYTFTSGNKLYELVKETKTWAAAAACAVQRGGHLVEINDQAEQTAVYNFVVASGSGTSTSIAADGGYARYFWIGGTDRVTNGTWIWDGDNNQSGTNFWNGEGALGANNGSPVNGAFENWGRGALGGNTAMEPDNFAGSQSAVGVALNTWAGGEPGQWNDLDESDILHYVIEKPLPANATGGAEQSSTASALLVLPNPAKDHLELQYPEGISSIALYSAQGQLISATPCSGSRYEVNSAQLAPGLYTLLLTDSQGRQLTRKIIKE